MKTLPKHILRESRVDAANQLLEVIATTGRCLYSHSHPDGTQIARLEIPRSGHLRLWNEWRRIWIYVSLPPPWKGFHHGGTAVNFIEHLKRFIRTGDKLPVEVFSSHWGYGTHMLKVIQAGQAAGVIQIQAAP